MSQLSPSEKKGLLVLLGIILIGFIFQWLQPFVVKTDLYDYSVQDSIFKAISEDTTIILQKDYYKEKKSNTENTQKVVAPKKDLLPYSININMASQPELEKLPRIGPVTAKNILEYRAKNGSFNSIDELTKVKRIGPKTLEVIRPYIVIK